MSRTTHTFALLLGALLVMVTAPAFADRAPDWMVGTFEGYNQRQGMTVLIRINDQGNLIVSHQRNGQQEIARNPASYRRGILTIDDQNYRVERTDEGFRTVLRNDPGYQVAFRRIGDYDENWRRSGAQRLPDWMVGTFEGYNRRRGMHVTIRMNDRGNLIVSHQKNGQQEVARDTASYRRGMLTIDNQTYRVERTDDGFRTILRSDPDYQVDFKRSGGYSANWRNGGRNVGYNGENRLPDWMVGTFEGYNRKYSQTITIRANDRGSLTVTNRKRGQNIARNTATYRRGVLTIDNQIYRVEKTDDGFRTIQRDDPGNQVEFRRIGG